MRIPAKPPVTRADRVSDRHPFEAPVIEVDVREDLRNGREPFSRIMAGVGALRENEVLHVRAIFEPAPLFAVLAKKGFVHESLSYAPDDWSVWFWRPIGEEEKAPPAVQSQAPVDSVHTIESKIVELDVRGLAPPEPMLRTLAALETLSPDNELMQINTRVPQFLLPILAERGFACDVDASNADRVLVRIWRPQS